MAKVLLIDDSQAFLDLLAEHIETNYPALQVVSCCDPIKSLALIDAELDLLLVDLEMPNMDGGKILSYAIAKGVPKGKIIILSGRDADYLHEKFPMGECLAVMNKHETRQQEVFNMILNVLQKKTTGVC